MKQLIRSLARAVLLACLLCFTAGVVAGTGSATADRAADWPGQYGITYEKIKRAGLSIRWIAQLPFVKKQQLIDLNYRDGQLYARSDNNNLFKINGLEGTISWSIVLANNVPSCSKPYYFEQRAIYVLARNIVEVDIRTGSIIRTIALPFSPTTMAARNADYGFIGGDDNYFYCIRLRDGVMVWKSICPSEPTGNVFVHDDKVYFTDKNGTLYVSMTTERNLVWKYPTAGTIPGFVLDNGQVFAPSKDTAVYGFDALNGKQLWPRYLTGGSLDQAPLVTDTSLYQPMVRDGLVCLDRGNGKLRWQFNDAENILSETEKYTYVMSLKGELIMIDNHTNKQHVSFLLPDTDVYARNTEDGLIFLGTADGVIVALQPKRP